MFDFHVTDRPLQILLAEDNPGDIWWTKHILNECGIHYHLSVVENGEDVLNFLNRTGRFSSSPQPDLLLLDLNLPRITGHELLARIDPSVSICIVTGSVMERQKVITLFKFDARCYLIKPLECRDFIKATCVFEHLRPWLPSAHDPLD